MKKSIRERNRERAEKNRARRRAMHQRQRDALVGVSWGRDLQPVRTQREVAALLGIARSTVERLERTALLKIQRALLG